MQSHTSPSKKENAPPSPPSEASQSNGPRHSNGASQAANETGQHEDTASLKPHEPTEDPDSAAESSSAAAELEVLTPTPNLRRRPPLERSTPHLSFEQLMQIMGHTSSSPASVRQERSDPQAYLQNARAQARQELPGKYPESPPRMPAYLAHLVREPAPRGPRKSFGEATRETHNWAHLLGSPTTGTRKAAGKRKAKSESSPPSPPKRKRSNALSIPIPIPSHDDDRSEEPPLRIDANGNPILPPPRYQAAAAAGPSEPAIPLRLDEHGRPISPPPYPYPDRDPDADVPSRPVVRFPPSRRDEVDMDDGVWLGREDMLSGGLGKFAAARRALQRSMEVDEVVRKGGMVDEVD